MKNKIMENLLYNKTFKNLINILIGVLIIFLAFSVFNLIKDEDKIIQFQLLDSLKLMQNQM